jgi:hypothetical protein
LQALTTSFSKYNAGLNANKTKTDNSQAESRRHHRTCNNSFAIFVHYDDVSGAIRSARKHVYIRERPACPPVTIGLMADQARDMHSTSHQLLVQGHIKLSETLQSGRTAHLATQQLFTRLSNVLHWRRGQESTHRNTSMKPVTEMNRSNGSG